MTLLGGRADGGTIIRVTSALTRLAGTVPTVGRWLSVGISRSHTSAKQGGGEEQGGEDALHDLPQI